MAEGDDDVMSTCEVWLIVIMFLMKKATNHKNGGMNVEKWMQLCFE